MGVKMTDFWNIAHTVGGAAAAFIVIAFGHKNLIHWVTIIFAALSGFVVNFFWELIVDVFGWFTFFGRAGTPDINDVIRGGIASIVIAILYCFALRKKYGTWRF